MSSLSDIADGISERARDARESVSDAIDSAMASGNRLVAAQGSNARAVTNNIATTATAGANALKWIAIIMVIAFVIIPLVAGIAFGAFQLYMAVKS